MLVKLGVSSIWMARNNGNRGVPSSSITVIFLAQFLALSRLSVIFYSRLIDGYINSTREIRRVLGDLPLVHQISASSEHEAGLLCLQMTRRNKKEALCFPHLKETVGFQERVLRTGLTRKVLKLFAHLF